MRVKIPKLHIHGPKDMYSSILGLRFFHIPKNAMTAVIRSQISLENKRLFKWTPLKNIPHTSKTFCVLREPLDRAISSYIQVKGMWNHPRKKLLYANIMPSKYLKLMFTTLPEKEGIKLYLEFTKKYGFVDGHNEPQINWISSNQHAQLTGRKLENIDYFVDFEHIEKDLKKITGKKIKIFSFNVASSDFKKRWGPIFNLYKDLVYEIYGEDLKLYKEKIRR